MFSDHMPEMCLQNSYTFTDCVHSYVGYVFTGVSLLNWGDLHHYIP